MLSISVTWRNPMARRNRRRKPYDRVQDVPSGYVLPRGASFPVFRPPGRPKREVPGKHVFTPRRKFKTRYPVVHRKTPVAPRPRPERSHRRPRRWIIPTHLMLSHSRTRELARVERQAPLSVPCFERVRKEGLKRFIAMRKRLGGGLGAHMKAYRRSEMQRLERIYREC